MSPRTISAALAALLAVACASAPPAPVLEPDSLRARLAQRDPDFEFLEFLRSGGFGAQRRAVGGEGEARAFLARLEAVVAEGRGKELYYATVELADRLHGGDLWAGVPVRDSGRAAGLLHGLLGPDGLDPEAAPFDRGMLSLVCEDLLRVTTEGGPGIDGRDREAAVRRVEAWYAEALEELERAGEHEALGRLHLDRARQLELYGAGGGADRAGEHRVRALACFERAIGAWEELAPGDARKDAFTLAGLHLELAALYGDGGLPGGIDEERALEHYEEARILGRNVDKQIARLLGRPEAPVLRVPARIQATPGRRVALVIGNGSYRNARDLRNPAADAGAVAAALGRLGFEVVLRTDVGRFGMRTALATFGEKTPGAAVALVYFAGHGVQVDGVNYLLPVDVQLRDERDLANYALPLDDVMQQFDPSTGARLVVLDACRDNPLAAQLAGGLGGNRAAAGLAALTRSPANTLIAYSTSPGATADDGEGAHSPYAASLLNWLEQPVELGELFRRVRDEVRRRTEGTQEPWESSSLGGEDLYLAGS